MNCDLVSFTVDLLDGRVVAVLVRHKVCGFDVTAIGVLALSVEHLLVEFDVVVVDSIIERHGDHHGDVFGGQATRNCSTILGAEAIGQHADGGIARWGTIGVIVDICIL